MSAILLDGKKLAGEMQAEITQQIAQFVQSHKVHPCLAAILVGEDAASQVYVRNKQRACERVGIQSRLVRLAEQTPQDALLALITDLNQDPAIHAILVQLPLPKHLSPMRVVEAIHPLKDVDALHPENVGRLAQGRPRFLPCTPHGVLQILHRNEICVAGQHVVVLGRSEIVGKPLAMMLMQRDSTLGATAVNATVTVCHSRTRDLAAVTRQADILVAAIGQAGWITAEMIKPGATVIDVGVNRTDQGLAGDVDFASVRPIASHITPVPGGVGPLTITMLLHNTLLAAELQLRSPAFLTNEGKLRQGVLR